VPNPVAVPVIVTTTESTAVAIQGAAIQAVSTTATAPALAPLPQSVTPGSSQQTNLIQRAAADPRRTVDYFTSRSRSSLRSPLFLDIFVKVRIQHPQVIMGGMLVILIAGLFIVLNQHFGGTGVVIL